MARITIQDVKTSMGITETYDIINMITNDDPRFQQYVPLANAENIAQVGAGILLNQTLQNDFLTSLIDRIGLVVVRHVHLHNPLGKFKKGMMPQGRTIEDIFTDISKGKKYDPDDAESTVFKRAIPNVKTLFHERNRQDFYDATVSDEQLRSAFISWGHFENFLTGVIGSIYNSAESEEYEYMKFLIDNYYSKGLFTVIPVVDPVDATSAKEMVKKLRATATKMTLQNGSRDYNALAVKTASTMDSLHLIIDADLEAEIDVDVLASAFNMSKSDFLGHRTVIDGFASSGLKAVLVDEEWFMVYDNLLKLETIRNPKGLYWTYFYHVWQTLSASRFANAVAFVTGDVKAVTSVIVDPTVAALKAGKTLEMNAYVRATDGNVHDVVWNVAASTSSTTKQAGTSINSDGLLTLDAAQIGELLVTASTSFLDNDAKTTLSASAASGATTITVGDSSKFSVGDELIVGTETAAIKIASIGSATSITLENGLVNAQASGADVTKQDTVTGESIITVVPA